MAAARSPDCHETFLLKDITSAAPAAAHSSGFHAIFTQDQGCLALEAIILSPCPLECRSSMPSLSRNAVLALIGATLVLHDAEEYLTFPAVLSAPGRLPGWLPPPRLLLHSRDIHIALVMATVLALAVISWAILRPAKIPLILSLLIESILLVNAAWHVFASLIVRGYAPGVITAVLINLPFGVYVLRRAVNDQWIQVRTAWQLIGSALLLHFVAVGSVLAG
jgi:hypothetical protein